jgi:hypothetical protein
MAGYPSHRWLAANGADLECLQCGVTQRQAAVDDDHYVYMPCEPQGASQCEAIDPLSERPMAHILFVHRFCGTRYVECEQCDLSMAL